MISDSAAAYHNEGDVLKEQKQPGEAEKLYEQSLQIKERLAADHPEVPEYQDGLALAYRQQGDQQRGGHLVGQCVHSEPIRDIHGHRQPGGPQRVTGPEPEHHREQGVVRRDEDDARREARERVAHAGVRDQAVEREDEAGGRDRGQRVERVVADVERLAVPAVPVLEPLRDVLREREQGHELRPKEQHRRDDEDDARVVRLVPRRPDDEELRYRGARGEDQEGRPAGRPEREPDDERRGRAHRGHDHRSHVEERGGREPDGAGTDGSPFRLHEARFDGDRGHV